MGPARTAVLVLVVTATVWIGFGLTPDAGPSDEPIDDALVRPIEDGSAIWPYTSRSRSVSGRTLALNLVVVGEPDAVRLLLTNRTAVDWEPAENDSRARIGAAGIGWRTARGAARYTYVRGPDDGGRWMVADYQLASGHYLGSRVHIRTFSSPDREWTALQAHQEYWDWFRLRHTVTGVSSAGEIVRADLGDEPAVADFDRLHHGQRGGGSDGWLWVVEMALATLLFGSLDGSGRLDGWQLHQALRRVARGLPLAAGLGALYLGVRLTGIALELTIPAIDPRLFAVPLYPALVGGIPALVWHLAPRHRPIPAFGLASLGLGIGIGLDLWLLGVTVLPSRLLLHRGMLLAAIGVLAAGCAQPGRPGRHIRWLGVAAWVGALLLPLADLV